MDIHKLAEEGRLNELEEHLFSNPKDIHKTEKNGNATPLHLASIHNHIPIVKLLISKGADINSNTTNNGMTPLFCAVFKGHLSLTEFLISEGATVNATDKANMTPLHWAIRFNGIRIAKILISHGADLDVKCGDYGFTPLMTAKQYCDEEMINLIKDALTKKNSEVKVGLKNETKDSSSSPVKKHAFLSHNWGSRMANGKYDNHEKVWKIFSGLERNGISCWFDSEQMSGNITRKMAEGIDNSDSVIVFITNDYINKVNGDRADDNCQLEFNYAAQSKTKKKMVAVVLDPACRDTGSWTGQFGIILRGELYVDFCNDDNFDENLQNLQKEIEKRISTLPSTTVPLVGLMTNEIGILATKLSMGMHSSDFTTNDVSGEHLSYCETIDDLEALLGGVSISKVRGKLFLEKIKKFGDSGVPKELLE